MVMSNQEGIPFTGESFECRFQLDSMLLLLTLMGILCFIYTHLCPRDFYCLFLEITLNNTFASFLRYNKIK
jgi:hypothetical protein